MEKFWRGDSHEKNFRHRVADFIYSQMVQVAKKEFSSGELPALKNLPNVDAYDKIILIYPLWWHTLLKSVENFLLNVDLRSKKLYPIVSHGGGLGESIDALKF